MAAAKKKSPSPQIDVPPPLSKEVAAVSADSFDNRQLTLFQGFLANTASERDALSNAVELWDSIPRYSISRLRMNGMRTAEGFLSVHEIAFQFHGKQLTVRLHPAQVKGEDGKWTSYYPSAREELVEHALRKIATEQRAGFYDQPGFRSGTKFSLHQLRKELVQQGHALRYDELVEALAILSLSSIEIEGRTEEGESAFARSTYIAALSGVKRDEYDKDRSTRWVAQFHPLVTRSIDQVTYRQFNYQRLMRCTSQLSRWLMSQLVLKYTAAATYNSFEMRYSTIKRDSAMLYGYKVERQAVAALDAAWKELQVVNALASVTKNEQRNKFTKLEDVVYKLVPTKEFTAEQKAANRRSKDAHELGRPAPSGAQGKSAGLS